MTIMRFSAATDAGLAEAMEEDPGVITWGENVRLLRRELLLRFGDDRVVDTPTTVGAFLHAGVGAATSGRRPVGEVNLTEFLATAWTAILHTMPKMAAFTTGTWPLPVVVRAACGGGHGAGRHEQALWGALGAIPGLTVVVPSIPTDAAALMLAAVRHDGPVVYLEHRLLAETWLDRLTAPEPGAHAGLPPAAVEGDVPLPVAPVPLGQAVLRRPGSDVALISLGTGVHRAMTAAERLAPSGVDAAVLDLRGVAPIDRDAVVDVVRRTGRVVVVDEDYVRGGLSGEIAALIAESGLHVRYARVAVETAVPFATQLADESLPSVERIVAAVRSLDRPPPH